MSGGTKIAAAKSASRGARSSAIGFWEASVFTLVCIVTDVAHVTVIFRFV